MREECIGPYNGIWRHARKVFRCMYHHGAERGRCAKTVAAGERYYDTCEGAGLGSFRATSRICAECASELRAQVLWPNRFDCAECGQGIAVDEDGCCRACGADATVILNNEVAW